MANGELERKTHRRVQLSVKAMNAQYAIRWSSKLALDCAARSFKLPHLHCRVGATRAAAKDSDLFDGYTSSSCTLASSLSSTKYCVNLVWTVTCAARPDN